MRAILKRKNLLLAKMRLLSNEFAHIGIALIFRVTCILIERDSIDRNNRLLSLLVYIHFKASYEMGRHKFGEMDKKKFPQIIFERKKSTNICCSKAGEHMQL